MFKRRHRHQTKWWDNFLKDLTDKHKISSDEATKLLMDNQPIRDKIVFGLIELSPDSNDLSVIIDNSEIEGLIANSVNFNKQVVIRNSRIKRCEFQFAYFLGGLSIAHSTFDSYLDFQCGGHNQDENKIELSNNDFRGFVNFFDCVYNGPVVIKQNNFQKGTNISGNKGKSWETQFDSLIELVDNEGKVDVNGEGE